ncbi:MAG: peptidase and in kexin sedolisin [Symbiobacteriaceae bacterium]|jgi:serine protease AprX|nr:peptidase and in kexin sedolisin [Symbiobacteriaceae bacterium]
MSDYNRDKVFDNLDPILARAAETEKIPVLIMARRPQDLDLLEQAVGPLEVKYRYTVVPAMAASVTKSQVEALAKESACKHIEYDAEVRIAMDGANRWFGAAQARADFGVSGDRDGSAGYSRDDVVVAVIDTGIDANHVDLAGGKVIAWNDWVGGRTTPYDDNGHGTHVAGIVAGTGAGNPNFVGVAPGAALIGLKVLNGAGSGSLSNVAAAVDWAVANKDQHNIKIISMNQAQVLPTTS